MAFKLPRSDTAFSVARPGKETRRIEDPAHLAFIRSLPSIISGKMPCEACHIRAGSAVHRKKQTGMGQKPDDCWTLPMTPEEHREQHAMNETDFWRQHGIDPFAVAAQLYARSGERGAAEAILAKARA